MLGGYFSLLLSNDCYLSDFFYRLIILISCKKSLILLELFPSNLARLSDRSVSLGNINF
jgi:hypothetical protein